MLIQMVENKTCNTPESESIQLLHCYVLILQDLIIKWIRVQWKHYKIQEKARKKKENHLKLYHLERVVTILIYFLYSFSWIIFTYASKSVNYHLNFVFYFCLKWFDEFLLISLHILQNTVLINDWKYSFLYIFHIFIINNSAVNIFMNRSFNIYMKAFICITSCFPVILICNSTSRVSI